MISITNPEVEMPDEQLAMALFRSIRWVYGVYCPHCKSYNINNRGIQGRVRRYSCKDCGTNFNDFTGTFFYKSKIPLGVMIYILFNMDTKTVKELVEETGYSRQCISRITKLFRDKLLENPDFYHKDEETDNYLNE
ncbi:MAG: transposase [Methanobacteriaceae archaeon]|nr:transposase [Methanobacteriaceae archaeon]